MKMKKKENKPRISSSRKGKRKKYNRLMLSSRFSKKLFAHNGARHCWSWSITRHQTRLRTLPGSHAQTAIDRNILLLSHPICPLHASNLSQINNHKTSLTPTHPESTTQLYMLFPPQFMFFKNSAFYSSSLECAVQGCDFEKASPSCYQRAGR